MTRLRNPYLWLVSALGVLLIAWSAAAIPGLDRLDQLVLIALLAIAAQGTITFTDSGGYISVGSAISLSTVPLYGPAAAVLIAAIAEITPWFIMIRRKPGTWHDALEHLLFNVGMSTLAAYLASLTFLAVQGFFPPDSVQALLAPWLPAALVGDQVNFWFLVGILYLANGASPRETWRAHRWAIPLNLTLTTLGGGMLAVAAQQFGTLGILIFFLPIILSAYAFRLYVNKTREQMDRLEELVNQRTGELAQANEEMRELYEQKDAFLSVLTHDMRSPLTSIHGFATMLRDRPELPPEKRTRMADIIVRSERALLEIVNNVLDIEKMESGSELLLERDQFDIHDLLREVAELSLAQAYEKSIKLRLEPAQAPIYLQADRQKIQRVMQNLLSNALKYTPDGGDVCVSVRGNGRYALIDVADTGYGIPEEDLPYVFDRYRRVAGHKSRAVGTGLGLAIVKNLVDAHEGQIEVQSKVNVGSTFTVKLPL